MTIRERILEEARSWIGTPFHHQARTKGVGVDCAGLIVGVGQALGFDVQDHPRRNYSRYPVAGRALIEHVRGQSRVIPFEEAKPGSVLVFWVHRPNRPQHMAILSTEGRMIHAYHDARRVIESHMGPYWNQRLFTVFDHPEVLRIEAAERG